MFNDFVTSRYKESYAHDPDSSFLCQPVSREEAEKALTKPEQWIHRRSSIDGFTTLSTRDKDGKIDHYLYKRVTTDSKTQWSLAIQPQTQAKVMILRERDSFSKVIDSLNLDFDSQVICHPPDENIKKINKAIEDGDIPSFCSLAISDATNLNNTGWHKRTPLHIAAALNKIEFACRILNHAALRKINLNMNALDDEGLTPLHHAARKCHHQMIILLLENGADVNAKDDLGRTAIMYACKSNQLETVIMLVDKRADVTVSDKNNKKVLDYCKKESPVYQYIENNKA